MQENRSETMRDPAAQEPSVEILAQALTRALAGITIQLDGEAVGRLVYPTVDSEIGRAAYNSRYGG